MKNPAKRIPYSRQSIGKEEKQAVQAVLNSDWLTQGPKVEQFEKAFARKVHAKYAVAVANGTAALHLASLCLGLEPGDEVITTPISFLATSNSVLYCGAKPVFTDIDTETQNIDADAIEKRITKKTKAIYVTHFAGYSADMQRISKIARRFNLSIIEDGAHALGGTYQKNLVGSCKYSIATAFSFHPVKHITTGEGGALTTNNQNFYERLLQLRTHGVTRNAAKLKKKNAPHWHYEMQSLGFNYRMSDLQAALGIAQLKKLADFIQARREAAAFYSRAFRDFPEIETPIEDSGSKHAYHLYVIRLKGQKLVAKRRRIFEALIKKGLGVQIHYIPIPMQPFYRDLGYRYEDYPRAKAYYESAISIPIFPKITQSEQNYVVSTIKTVIDSFK